MRSGVPANAAPRGILQPGNNAGYGYLTSIKEGDEAGYRAQFEANVFGLFAMTRAVLPAMRERGSGQAPISRKPRAWRPRVLGTVRQPARHPEHSVLPGNKVDRGA